MAGRYSKEYRPNEFVKLPFEEVAKVMAMKEQQYQQGYLQPAAYQQEMGKVEVRTPDVEYHQQLIKQATDKARQLAEETYGGDYGAAASDITRTLANEASNPFYSWTKSKMDEYKKAKAIDMELTAKGQKLGFNTDLLNKSYFDRENNRYNTELGFDVEQKLDWTKEMNDVAARNIVQFQNSIEESLDNALTHKNKSGRFEQTTRGAHGTKLSQGEKGRAIAYEDFKGTDSYAQMKKTLTQIGWDGKQPMSEAAANEYIEKTFNGILNNKINSEPIISRQEISGERVSTKNPVDFRNNGYFDAPKLLSRGDELSNPQLANSTPKEQANYRINYHKDFVSKNIVPKVIDKYVAKSMADKNIEEKLNSISIRGNNKGEIPNGFKFGDIYENLDNIKYTTINYIDPVDLSKKTMSGSGKEIKSMIRNQILTTSPEKRDELILNIGKTLFTYNNPNLNNRIGGFGGIKFDISKASKSLEDKKDAYWSAIDNTIKSKSTLKEIINQDGSIPDDLNLILGQYKLSKDDLNKPIDEIFSNLSNEEAQAISATRANQIPISNQSLKGALLNIMRSQSRDSGAIANISTDNKSTVINMSDAIGRIDRKQKSDDITDDNLQVSYSGKDFIIHLNKNEYLTIPINNKNVNSVVSPIMSVSEQVSNLLNSKHRNYGIVKFPGQPNIIVYPDKQLIYFGEQYVTPNEFNNMIGNTLMDLITPYIPSKSTKKTTTSSNENNYLDNVSI